MLVLEEIVYYDNKSNTIPYRRPVGNSDMLRIYDTDKGTVEDYVYSYIMQKFRFEGLEVFGIHCEDVNNPRKKAFLMPLNCNLSYEYDFSDIRNNNDISKIKVKVLNYGMLGRDMTLNVPYKTININKMLADKRLEKYFYDSIT